MFVSGGGGGIPPLTPDNALPFLIALIIVVGVIYFAVREFMG
jgi:hypothetical protein